MLPTFIDRVIDDLLAKETGNDYSCFHVVFPTRRAALIFKTKFAERLKKAAFMPQAFSVGDFIAENHPQQIADRKELLLELYSIYIEYFPATTYSSFVPWGEMILGDYDEIERYDVDAGLLYAGIKSLKEIDILFENDPEQTEQIKKFWGLFTDKEPSILKEKFSQTWNILPLMYVKLNEKLAAKNKITEGKAIREIALNPATFLKNIPVDRVVLAGFYALTKSEELLYEYISKNKGLLLWDADSYYTDDKKQEAGFFFRNNKLTTGNFSWKENYLLENKKQITVSGTPLAAGQIKHLTSTLQELVQQNKINLDKTVVILPDETMLALLLQSLPPEIKELNVTMGFPSSETMLYRFLTKVEQLKVRSQYKDKEVFIHVALWKELLMHPYAKAILGNDEASVDDHKSYFVPLSQLKLKIDHPLYKLLKKNPDAASTFDFYRNLLESTISYLDEKQEATQKEIAAFVLNEIKELEALANPYFKTIDSFSAEMLIKDIFESSRIPFSGEPVKGLQVMGFLETRTLDFENVFIINVNEGSLPRLTKHNSFIPYALRKGFGLPTYEEQDAISSYHFWRLMHRAENIHLIYNTQVNDFAGGEKSRYLLQLFYEMQPALKDTLSMQHRVVSTPLINYKTVKPEYKRNDALTEKLISVFTGESANRQFSATSLQSFINCSLQFYFRYIENIKEPDESTEEIDGAMFGKIFHDAASALYLPYKDIPFTSDAAKEIKKQINNQVTLSIQKEYDGHYNKKGYAFLIEKIIERYTEHIVELDLTSEKFSPVDFEGLYRSALGLRDNKTAIIKGTFDRVDKLESSYRIVDYKTGNDAVENAKTVADIFSDSKYKINLQLLLYVWLAKQNNFDLPINAGIYPLRRISSGIETIEEGNFVRPEIIDQFSIELKKIIENIIFETDFIQTDDLKKCAFCPYNSICNR